MRGVWAITLLVLLGTAGCADARRLMPVLRTALHESRAGAVVAAAPLAVPVAAAQAMHAPAMRQPAAAAPVPGGAVDMSGVLRAAVRLPGDVRRLHDIIVTALATVTILGLANIALMLTVLGRLSRVTREAGAGALRTSSLAAPASSQVARLPVSPQGESGAPLSQQLDEAAAVAPESIVKLVPAGESTTRICACGAGISLRSRTGRCRACARLATARAKRAAHPSDTAVHA